MKFHKECSVTTAIMLMTKCYMLFYCKRIDNIARYVLLWLSDVVNIGYLGDKGHFFIYFASPSKPDIDCVGLACYFRC